jgi:hypothetical protein
MRARFTLLTACLTLLLAGCLDYRERLTLNKDGSGSMVIDFVVDLGLMNEVAKAFGDQPDPNATKGPTKEEILKGLKVKGITVDEERLTVHHKGDKSKVHIELTFESLKALGQIEGFGDDRKVEFFDNGDGKVRVIYSFDTTDVIPLEELGDEPPPGEELDPTERKILEITARARDDLRFLGRVQLPGEILKSNGKIEKKPAPNARVWRIDKKADPRLHATLGRGRIIMKMLVERSTVPWVTELQPLPARTVRPQDVRPPEPPRKSSNDKRGALGD